MDCFQHLTSTLCWKMQLVTADSFLGNDQFASVQQVNGAEILNLYTQPSVHS